MPFLNGAPRLSGKKPAFCVILGNTLVSTIPGDLRPRPTPEKTLLTPNLDAELVTTGRYYEPEYQAQYPYRLPHPGHNHTCDDGSDRCSPFLSMLACTIP